MGRRAAAAPTPRLQAGLEALGFRLHAAHSQCQAVDDTRWADYVTQLDSGLDELHREVQRASEVVDQRSGQDADGQDIEQLLLTRTTALELAGWKLRMETLAAQAEQALDALHAGAAGSEARTEAQRALEALRARV